MDEEIKQDPMAASNDDGQATTPVAGANDAENAEVVAEPAVETDVVAEGTVPEVEVTEANATEDVAPEAEVEPTV